MKPRTEHPPARDDGLNPRSITAPNPGFEDADDLPDPVTLTVYGIVLDCPHCEQPTTAFLAFLPSGDPDWDQSLIVLCNTELALAVADAATSELAHIANAVGRPGYASTADSDLVNRCFHCEHPLTGDDLAAEVRRTYLDGLVELGPAQAPRRWVAAAASGAGSFVNHGDVPYPAAVPDFLTASPTARRGVPNERLPPRRGHGSHVAGLCVRARKALASRHRIAGQRRSCRLRSGGETDNTVASVAFSSVERGVGRVD